MILNNNQEQTSCVRELVITTVMLHIKLGVADWRPIISESGGQILINHSIRSSWRHRNRMEGLKFKIGSIVQLHYETSIPGIAPGIDSYPSLSRPRHLRPSWSSRSRSRADLFSASTSALASSITSLSRVVSDPSPSPPLVFCFLGHRLGSTICWNRGSTHRSSNQVCSLASTS